MFWTGQKQNKNITLDLGAALMEQSSRQGDWAGKYETVICHLGMGDLGGNGANTAELAMQCPMDLNGKRRRH